MGTGSEFFRCAIYSPSKTSRKNGSPIRAFYWGMKLEQSGLQTPDKNVTEGEYSSSNGLPLMPSQEEDVKGDRVASGRKGSLWPQPLCFKNETLLPNIFSMLLKSLPIRFIWVNIQISQNETIVLSSLPVNWFPKHLFPSLFYQGF